MGGGGGEWGGLGGGVRGGGGGSAAERQGGNAYWPIRALQCHLEPETDTAVFLVLHFMFRQFSGNICSNLSKREVNLSSNLEYTEKC